MAVTAKQACYAGWIVGRREIEERGSLIRKVEAARTPWWRGYRAAGDGVPAIVAVAQEEK